MYFKCVCLEGCVARDGLSRDLRSPTPYKYLSSTVNSTTTLPHCISSNNNFRIRRPGREHRQVQEWASTQKYTRHSRENRLPMPCGRQPPSSSAKTMGSGDRALLRQVNSLKASCFRFPMSQQGSALSSANVDCWSSTCPIPEAPTPVSLLMDNWPVMQSPLGGSIILGLFAGSRSWLCTKTIAGKGSRGAS